MRQLLLLSLLILTSLQPAAADINKAPAIDLPVDDGSVQLEKLSGKVVYLDFWASWCKPCAQSFPWMHEVKKRYADQGFEILAVNLDKDRELADAFLDKMAVNFIVAYDEQGKSAADYRLKGMPSSFLIDRDGSIYAAHIGFRDEDRQQLEQAIVELLNNK